MHRINTLHTYIYIYIYNYIYTYIIHYIIIIAAAGVVDRELLYIELGDLFPPHQQQQQHHRTTTTIINNNNNINSGMFVCRNGTWGRTGGRAGACARARVRSRGRARMGWRTRASLKKQSANNQRTNNKQQTANNKRTKNKVSRRFRDGFGTVSGRFRDGFGTVSKSGSIGTVLGTLLVPRPNFRPRKTSDLSATCESIWASDLQHY